MENLRLGVSAVRHDMKREETVEEAEKNTELGRQTPREKVSLRSPLSDGGKTSSGTELPIQEATTEKRSPSRALIDKSPGNQKSGLPQGVTAGSLSSSYHQYSSKYSAGTCPRVAETQPFLVFPRVSGRWWKTTQPKTLPSRADRGGTPVGFVRAA